MDIDGKIKKEFIRFQRNEITESLVYSRLASIEKDGSNKEILLNIAADEIAHGKVFQKYTKENLEKMLEALSASDEYGIILRAKGMLPAEDGTWIYFDMVPEETEIREGAPEYTGRLCVIGSKLNEDKLAELFGL